MKICIVGSGLAGATAASVLRRLGHHVEVFEVRGHIGGNCHDAIDRGVMVQRYGPHCFHTNNHEVWNYLGNFTRFNDVQLRVLGNTALGMIPIPFNRKALEITGPMDDHELERLIFHEYSEKQWGIEWNSLPSFIKQRVMTRRDSEDCRYHLDAYQGIPERGYSEMIAAMLEGVTVHLGEGKQVWTRRRWDHVVYTGSIDEFFKYCHGRLPYRSLRFEYDVQPKRPQMQINECNSLHAWTRSVDHSHWLKQEVNETVIGKEFPCEFDGTNERYYPKPWGNALATYQRYRAMAEARREVTFVGRLATYKYLDMDDVVAQTLQKIGRLTGERKAMLPPHTRA